MKLNEITFDGLTKKLLRHFKKKKKIKMMQ